MTISIKEFIERIDKSKTDLFLLPCSDIIVYDNNTKIVYIPVTTHNSTRLNPMVDFRYHVGHMLLWSQHAEVDCSSDELQRALIAEGYKLRPYQEEKGHIMYAMYKDPESLSKASA
ncbi:MAG: hypothetical protein GX942_06895 [Papillibacter sp.]|jgi:hypothetical protein|nr:hypothetical protein [Papillibacter sp.]